MHVLNMTLAKINEMEWERLIHPLYSPDIAPSEYHLFASLSHFLAGRTFADLNTLKNGLKSYFDHKHVAFYRRGLELLPKNGERLYLIMVVISNNDCI